MTLLALVGVHALIFHRSVYGSTAVPDPMRAKLAGFLSLLLWAGIVFSGRLIAFDS
jgi:flagellar biosynthesis protein FliR